MDKKTLIKATLWVIAFLVIAFAAGFWFVFSTIADGISGNLATFGGVPLGAANFAGHVIATLVSGSITGVALRLVFGRLSGTWVVCGVVGVALATATYTWATANWFFDQDGKPLAYVCPPVHAGEPLRVQRQPVDHLLGGSCPPMTRELVPQVTAQQSGTEPQEIYINTLQELEAAPRVARGVAVLFAGQPSSPSAPPRLYRSGGLDPANGMPLRAASDADIRKMREYLLEKERLAAAKLAAEQKKAADEERAREAERLAAERKARAEIVNVAFTRPSLDEERRAAAEREIREKADAEQYAVNAPMWRKYFSSELTSARPICIVFGTDDQRVRDSICSELAGGSWWSQTAALPEFIGRFRDFADDPSQPLARDIFPPDLGEVIVVRVDQVLTATPDGAVPKTVAVLKLATLYVKTWQVRRQAKSIYVS